jgi:RNA-directed DNA polymerase
VLANGRYEAAKHDRRRKRLPSFNFLGFLHVWGGSINRKTGKRFLRVKLRTCPKRSRKKLVEIKTMIQKHRHNPSLIDHVIRVVEGYLNYFAVNDNIGRVSAFTNEVRRTLFKYLNRRSQRRSFTWEQFTRKLKSMGFPEAYVRHRIDIDLNIFRPKA